MIPSNEFAVVALTITLCCIMLINVDSPSLPLQMVVSILSVVISGSCMMQLYAGNGGESL